MRLRRRAFRPCLANPLNADPATVAPPKRTGLLTALALCGAALSPPATAGGYSLLGYGPDSYQSGGTVTAIGFDAAAGATNPAKLPGDRLDLGLQALMFHRTVDRTGSGTPCDFDTTSQKKVFPLRDQRAVSDGIGRSRGLWAALSRESRSAHAFESPRTI